MSELNTPAELAEWAFNYVRKPGGVAWYELTPAMQKHLSEMSVAVWVRLSQGKAIPLGKPCALQVKYPVAKECI